MLFDFFKKQTPEAQTSEPKIIREEVKVEVPVYSRFKFAHEDANNIHVKKYYLNLNTTTKYSDVPANDVFIYRLSGTFGTDFIYPVFRMPETLPATKSASPKKVICIGCFVVSSNDDLGENEIQYFDTMYSGKSLDDMVNDFHLEQVCDSLESDTEVYIMDCGNPITSKVITGEIDLDEFEKYLTLKNTIRFVTTNY